MLEDSFRVVSYYTMGTPYVDVAHRYLMNSIKYLGKELKSSIRAVPDLGSWQANTSYKPEFILNMLDHYDENIVFLDSDAELLGYPSLFDDIPFDYNFAAHLLNRDTWYNRNTGKEDLELLTGTLFVRNNLRSREILRKWKEKCLSSKIWEQKVLAKVLKDSEEPVYNLPIEYCWIKDLPGNKPPYVKPKGNIVIQHNQVSRVLKKKSNV